MLLLIHDKKQHKRGTKRPQRVSKRLSKIYLLKKNKQINGDN